MIVSFRTLLQGSAIGMALAGFFGLAQPSYAQIGGFGPGGGGGGNTSSLANQTGFNTQGVVRSTNVLANPMNFFQYGQTTGVGPIRGTVRIYNIFGTFAMQSGAGGGGGGGFGGGGFGGFGGGGGGGNFLGTNTGAGGFGTNLPGSGATQGDDGPQGTLLHVNYANMFFPNQQQVDLSNNAGAGGGGGGGFGGFPGFGGGFPGFGGKGYFGNGGSGL